VPYVHLVIVLALLEFWLFGFAVGRARIRYKVPAAGGPPRSHPWEIMLDASSGIHSAW
jgi:hypothetical protein